MTHRHKMHTPPGQSERPAYTSYVVRPGSVELSGALQPLVQALEAKPQGLGDLETRKIMWQIVRATDYLHSQDVSAFES